MPLLGDLSVACGADIDFLTTPGDVTFTAQGDVALIAGQALLQQRLYRRLVTIPGELLLYPDFGVGLAGYLNSPFTPQLRAQLEQAIAQQFALDPAVQSVQNVLLEMPKPGLLVVTVRVVVAPSLAVLGMTLTVPPTIAGTRTGPHAAQPAVV